LQVQSSIPGIIAGETAKSRTNARDLLAAFDTAAERANVSRETIFEKCSTIEIPNMLVDYARLRDLTIVPVPESYDQWYAEADIRLGQAHHSAAGGPAIPSI
jgi:hypothetical protein